MMKTSPEDRARGRHGSSWRRFATLSLAGAAMLFVVVACSTGPRNVGAPDRGGPTVLGVYQFELAGLATGHVTATVQRLDAEGELDSLSLGDTPLGGISVSPLGTGSSTCGSNANVWATFSVTGAPSGTTFIAYASAGNSVNGTAFSAVRDSNDADVPGATSITPTIGGNYACISGAPRLSNAGSLATVVYSESELDALESGLEPYTFVEAVFPYGFAVTNDQLLMGFRVPAGVNKVQWRAVAVQDDALRLALPAEFNDASGTTNLQAFAARGAALSQSAQEPVELVAIGSVSSRFLLLDADDWAIGSWSVELPWKVVPDVRLAGTPSTSVVHWVSGTSTPATAVRHFEVAIEFKSTGQSYTFVPTSGASVRHLVVAGGGAGGTPTGSNQAGGGGGAGGLLAGNTTTCPSGSCVVTVGKGGSAGSNGSNSILGNLTATGGGRGALLSDSGTGFAGGSGGGGGTNGGTSISGQGRNGGSGASAWSLFRPAGAGGGGGGASTPGGSGSASSIIFISDATGGTGGNGETNTITGPSKTYAAGGGGGSSYGTAGNGGSSNVGGKGAVGGTAATAPAQNTGSGGGGGSSSQPGGAGADGIVIVRYQVSQ